ncbi:MAG: hypothetical protein IT282_12645 [Bacteroidetes bacterium]|nr:hypothetical protein [Bacteroidota bacterium]
MSIHDLLGRAVWSIAVPHQPAGEYDVSWEGTGLGGRSVSSGAYILRLVAGSTQLTRKVVMIR